MYSVYCIVYSVSCIQGQGQGQKDKRTKGQMDKRTKGKKEKRTKGQKSKSAKGQKDTITKKNIILQFMF